MVQFPVVVMEFLLTWRADARPQLSEDQPLKPKKGKEHPEEFSSYVSKLTYWWFNKLVIKGYKRPLTQKDLWTLQSRESSDVVVPKFEAFWKKEQAKAARGHIHVLLVTTGCCRQQSNLMVNHNVQTDSALIDHSANTPPPSTKQPSILKGFFVVFGPTFLTGALFKLFYDLLQFVSPQILKLIIGVVERAEFQWKGVFFACLMLTSATIQSISLSFYFYQMYRVATRFRTCLISAIYKKALSISNSARKKTTIGEIVNLMSVDVQKIADLMPFVNLVWSAPLQIFLAVYFLYQVLGVAIFVGLAVMILLMPINAFIAMHVKKLQNMAPLSIHQGGYFTKVLAGWQMGQMKMKDERVKLMNEILSGIKVLKFFAWELSFQDRVSKLRLKEIQKLKKMALLQAVTVFFWTCAPFMVALVTFATYVLTGDDHVLDAKKAFVSLALFNILRFPLTMLPMMVTMFIQVSSPTISCVHEVKDLRCSGVTAPPISIESGTFSWSKGEDPVLKEISLNVAPGSLVAVVGPVGCGKSSLLAAMLGDMDKLEGNVHLNGSVAYVAQLAWIQNATLRDNILFYKPYNQEHYNEVVEACALTSDLDILQGRDMTEIGERGINLSGGQKQRISLARAVYQDADIYLLDDPLSAVDVHVGKHIFNKVIGPQGILKKKTDLIVVLSQGGVVEAGTYTQLLERQGAFANFLVQYLSAVPEDEDPTVIEDLKAKIPPQLSSWEVSPLGILRSLLPKYLHVLDGGVRVALGSITFPYLCLSQCRDVQVKKKVYLQYFRSMNFLFVFFIFLSYIGLQSFAVGSNFWLSDWSNDKVMPDGTQDVSLRNRRLTIYGILGLGQGLCVLAGAILSAYAAMRASRVLHSDMLARILHCPMEFFETTPLGRVVNRFSKDVDTVDSTIPHNFRSWLLCTLQVVSILVVISHMTPIFLLVVGPIAIIYYAIQRVLPAAVGAQVLYVSTSRQLKRLESITKSPIYSYFSETLSGVATIRAFHAQRRFVQECHSLVDTNVECFYPSVVANRWLEVRLELCGNLIVFFASLFSVLQKDVLTPGDVGLTISYALSMTATLNWMVRMSSELEANIVSVERINEYINLPIEVEHVQAPWEVPETKPPPEWPQQGAIQLSGYSTRYRAGLDLVLRQLDVALQPGEKVGIVGRTGAGKSSLTLGLFRIVEPAEGTIQIDGKDIARLGLHELRAHLTIIPQDPVLFSGTLRSNLDPFGTHPDSALWTALEHAHLKSFVSNLPEGLQYSVAEGGSNLRSSLFSYCCMQSSSSLSMVESHFFKRGASLLNLLNKCLADLITTRFTFSSVDWGSSGLISSLLKTIKSSTPESWCVVSVGQCQLVCLARALLKKTKVLVLDEATAAVDLETDDLIQSTIRSQFADCTVLTIAHRLNTIMDYDKVLVLEKGKVLEYDSPTELLRNHRSQFYSMARDANLVA
ncbi:hypothetical protein LAZ67_1000843 [Cordylochernes scorpioides]|uniref:Uncharacterized protein n=1 Tax=Cordylochernes scorpioides TaxID=51811 RepID=A0ABY6JXF7_9ARAC|nr:hypothetical protein LAZ67_1000843 [Cordylochernes scorpioides]